MSEQTELADLIRQNRTNWVTNTEHREMEVGQSAAIISAGYRKPRTVTTVEELDLLPDGTVVMDTFGNASNIRRHNPRISKEDHHYLLGEPGDFVVVLHEPGASA